MWTFRAYFSEDFASIVVVEPIHQPDYILVDLDVGDTVTEETTARPPFWLLCAARKRCTGNPATVPPGRPLG